MIPVLIHSWCFLGKSNKPWATHFLLINWQKSLMNKEKKDNNVPIFHLLRLWNLSNIHNILTFPWALHSDWEPYRFLNKIWSCEWNHNFQKGNFDRNIKITRFGLLFMTGDLPPSRLFCGLLPKNQTSLHQQITCISYTARHVSLPSTSWIILLTWK